MSEMALRYYEIREGLEALSVTPPRASFSSLPRELRDRIYGFSLISPSPIIVWDAKVKHASSSSPNELARSRIGLTTSRSIKAKLKLVKIPPLRHLGLGLLRCSRAIASEASIIFYQRNSFKFSGRHNWNPIVDWLERTGAQNRGYLTSLRVSAPMPVYVWEGRNGTRERLDPDGNEGLAICEPIYPRHVRFAAPLEAESGGLAQNINPAIEQLFALLAHNNGPKVTITLDMCYSYIPGVMRGHEKKVLWPDLDLPNFVEAVRADYASKENSRLIDVNWEGSVLRTRFVNAMTKLEESGWDIREEWIVEGDTGLTVLGAGSSGLSLTAPTSTTHLGDLFSHYILSRKELTGPLTAEAPFSRSRLYRHQVEILDASF